MPKTLHCVQMFTQLKFKFKTSKFFGPHFPQTLWFHQILCFFDWTQNASEKYEYFFLCMVKYVPLLCYALSPFTKLLWLFLYSESSRFGKTWCSFHDYSLFPNVATEAVFLFEFWVSVHYYCDTCIQQKKFFAAADARLLMTFSFFMAYTTHLNFTPFWKWKV